MIFGDLVDAAVGLIFGGSPMPWDVKSASPGPSPLADAIARGWRNWIPDYMNTFTQESHPSDFRRVWIWRLDWPFPKLVDPSALDPSMNVCGLLWKPYRGDDEAQALLEQTSQPKP